MAVRAETQVDLARVNDGTPGANGATFTPSVDASGNISWTNDGGLPNPVTQNIKGPQGDEGPTGPQGPTGPAGPGISYVTLTNGADLNSCIGKDTIYVTSSTAVCTSLLNAPTGKPDGELQMEVLWMGDNNYLVQRLTCKNGAIRKVYLRTYSAGSFGEWTEEGVSYGTSTTAASTAAKTATISNWNRDSDPYVAIKFTNENTASSPTLNINSTGAASIMTNGSNSAYWAAGATVNFYWDGTYYQVANSPVYASTVTVGNPSGDNVFIGNSAVQVKDGSKILSSFENDGLRVYSSTSYPDPIASFTTGGAVIGTSTGNQAYYVSINQGELDFNYAGLKRAYIEYFEAHHLHLYCSFGVKINNNVVVSSSGNVTSTGYIRDTVDTQTLTVGSSFNLYTAGEDITLKRSGNFIDLSGAVKPKNNISGSATEYTICTVPDGYRPSSQIDLIMPGSTQYKWLLRIYPAGSVTFSRYSASTSYAQASTSAWLPFHATWVLG